MDSPMCPATGQPMFRGVKPMTLRYKDRETTFDMPGWYCGCCDESIHSGADMKVSDRALRRLKVAVDNVLTPEEVRRIRKRLGLTQKAASQLIGGGVNAFQKYESGDVQVSHAITNVLVLLDRDPGGLAVLRERAHGLAE